MTDSMARHVAALLAERGWNQQDLVREAGVNKNTVSDFLTGKTRPSRSTQGKIERALGLTPGTLAGAGEEPFILDRSRLDHARLGHDLTDVPAEELLVELTAKVRNLKRRVAELEAELAATPAQKSDDDAATPPTLSEVRELKRQRMLDRGMPVEEAAYDEDDES